MSKANGSLGYSIQISILLLLIFYFFFDIEIYTAFGISIFCFSFLEYLQNIGKNLPVVELMLMLCGYQWIIATHFSYVTDDQKYPMAVTEEVYMSITVLLYLGLVIGVYWSKKEIEQKLQVLIDLMKKESVIKIAYIFIIVGLFSHITRSVTPSSLLYFNHLSCSLMYVGGLMFIYSEHKYKWLFFYGVFGYLLIKVISGAVFNEFISWCFFIIMYLAHYFKYGKLKILALILVAFLALSILQTIKPYYRSILWSGYKGNKIELFVGILWDSLSGNLLEEDNLSSESIEDLNSRANQGWVYARIYSHVPNNEPYANGSTILDAVKESFLPRFLFPNKKPTFQKDLFEKYTGRMLQVGTSMGLGIPGEAYANFGKWGSFIFMLVYALAISWIIKIYMDKMQIFPILFFLVPIYFEMIIRAISTFSQVMNWQIKSAVFIWMLYRFYQTQVYEKK